MSRTLSVKVRPNARQESLEEQADGSWIASVKAPPVDGKANEALIALIARHFGIRRQQVSIRSGAGARLKRIDIADAD